MTEQTQPLDTNLPSTERKLSYGSVPMERAGGGGMLLPQTFGEVVAFAQVMARADIAIPKHLRGNDGACMGVAMQAFRWEMDPFAVANKTYLVNDRLAYEAQLVASVIHTRAPILGRPSYVFSGEGQKRRCTVTCTMLDGETREYTSPEVGKITTKNSPLWKSDEDQQLGYFSIRSWGRRHTPEVILGVYTPDEVAEMRDVTPRVTNTSLRENLEAQVATSTGFAPGNVDSALADAEEAVFETIESEPAEPVSQGGGAETPAEAVKAPTPPETGAPEARSEPPEPDVLDVDLSSGTQDQMYAWMEGFKAKAIRIKDADELGALWSLHFKAGRMKTLHEKLAGPYGALEEWFAARIRKVRENPQ